MRCEGSVDPKREKIVSFTVVLRPLVHGVSPVTTKVHWIESSQLGNQPTIPIKGNPANAGAKFCNFLGLFGPGKLIVTVTNLN
jgi:hypothetical protein